MIQERYLDLMNGEIDGKNSPSESAELREHLESNAEARTYYAELRNVVEAFGEAGEVRVPEDLEQRIIFAINERRARDEAQRERASLLNIFSPRRKLGIAFAAGVVVGLIILLTIYRALPDSSTLRVKDLYGTLTERERTRTVATSDPVRFDHPEVTGTAIASYFDSDLVVSLELASAREIEVVIASRGMQALKAFSSRGCSPSFVQNAGESITLKTTGSCSFAVTFDDSGRAHPPVSVKIFADGASIVDETIVARMSKQH